MAKWRSLSLVQDARAWPSGVIAFFGIAKWGWCCRKLISCSTESSERGNSSSRHALRSVDSRPANSLLNRKPFIAQMRSSAAINLSTGVVTAEELRALAETSGAGRPNAVFCALFAGPTFGARSSRLALGRGGAYRLRLELISLPTFQSPQLIARHHAVVPRSFEWPR